MSINPLIFVACYVHRHSGVWKSKCQLAKKVLRQRDEKLEFGSWACVHTMVRFEEVGAGLWWDLYNSIRVQ